MNEPDLPSPRAPWRTLLAPLLIIGLCLVAWWGCLSADFYMDDFAFLVKDDRSGPVARSWLVLGIPVIPNDTPGAMTIEVFQLIPALMAVVSEKLAVDPANQPEYYHIWNLLLHTAAAVMAFFAGRSLLALAMPGWSHERRQRAAVLGALVFAMHPLCTEPVNYAKCTNSLTVVVFSLAALHGLFRLLAGVGGASARRWLVVGSVLTLFSYFPGTILLGGGVLLVLVWHWRRPGARPWKAEAAAAATWVRGSRLRLGVAGILFVLMLAFWGMVMHRQITLYGSSIVAHLLTQGRVFWDYLALFVWPKHLCSDHLVPWSTSLRDTEAVIKLAGCFVLAGGTVWCLLRAKTGAGRLAALLTALCLLPLVIRFLYVNLEVMVEYRTYPSLPWLGLGAGCVLSWAWERSRVAGPALAAGLILTCMTMSMQRTAVWGSQGMLAESVLARYPNNPRALLQFQVEQFNIGKYDRVRAMQDALIGGWAESYQENRGGIPGRQLMPSRFVNCIAASCGLMVHVTAAEEGLAAAEQWAASTKARLEAMSPHFFGSGAGESNTRYIEESLRRAREHEPERRRRKEAASARS